jgi:hypothetical protein
MANRPSVAERYGARLAQLQQLRSLISDVEAIDFAD